MKLKTIAPMEFAVFVMGIAMMVMPEIHWLVGLGFVLIGWNFKITLK